MNPKIKEIYEKCYDVIVEMAKETIEAELPRQKDIGSDKYWEMYQEVEEEIFKPRKV